MAAAITHAPPPGIEPDRGFVARETAARMQLLFERTQASMWFSAPAALMVVLLLWRLVPQPLLLGWLALKFGIFLLRVAVWWKRSHGWDDAAWLRAFTITVTLDGLAWSLLGTWLAPPSADAVTALLIATLVAAASIGAMVLSLHPAALYGFTGTMLLPVALWHGLSGAEFGWYVALGLGLFALFVLVEGRAMTRHLREMLRLRLLLEDEAQARSEALVLAERHSAVKSQFLANMSHEMRTPLHGILGLTRQLRDAGVTGPRERHIALIERSGEHLLGLINDALDFAKLEAGRARLLDEPFDLVALIEDVVALSGAGARDKGLLLDVSTAGLGRPGGWMRGDAARIRQILHNLVGNAVKFTDEGRVAVRAIREGVTGAVRIEVEDSGVGIAEAQLERVFDAFHQAEGAFDRRYTGTGLGLTIARELARAMGGDLSARSVVGQGSTFIFRAPLPPGLPDTLPPEGHATRPGAPRPQPLAGRVLVAEDNPVNALVVEAMLRQAGVDVELVDDGAQAVDTWERRAPDLVLMDLQMPVMDGLAATRAIREREALHGRVRTPIIALTANAFDSDRDDCLAAGMDDHLAKPFRDDELKALLVRYLGEVRGGAGDAARPLDFSI